MVEIDERIYSLLRNLPNFSHSRLRAGRPTPVSDEVIFKTYVLGRLAGLNISQIAEKVGMRRSAFSHRLHSLREMEMLKEKLRKENKEE